MLYLYNKIYLENFKSSQILKQEQYHLYNHLTNLSKFAIYVIPMILLYK